MDASQSDFLERPRAVSSRCSKTDHRERVGGAGASWAWAPDQVLQARFSERRMMDSGYQVALTETGTFAPFSYSRNNFRRRFLWPCVRRSARSFNSRLESIRSFDSNAFGSPEGACFSAYGFPPESEHYSALFQRLVLVFLFNLAEPLGILVGSVEIMANLVSLKLAVFGGSISLG